MWIWLAACAVSFTNVTSVLGVQNGHSVGVGEAVAVAVGVGEAVGVMVTGVALAVDVGLGVGVSQGGTPKPGPAAPECSLSPLRVQKASTRHGAPE
jgi:hypothetical protein